MKHKVLFGCLKLTKVANPSTEVKLTVYKFLITTEQTVQENRTSSAINCGETVLRW